MRTQYPGERENLTLAKVFLAATVSQENYSLSSRRIYCAKSTTAWLK